MSGRPLCWGGRTGFGRVLFAGFLGGIRGFFCGVFLQDLGRIFAGFGGFRWVKDIGTG